MKVLNKSIMYFLKYINLPGFSIVIPYYNSTSPSPILLAFFWIYQLRRENLEGASHRNVEYCRRSENIASKCSGDWNIIIS